MWVYVIYLHSKTVTETHKPLLEKLFKGEVYCLELNQRVLVMTRRDERIKEEGSVVESFGEKKKYLMSVTLFNTAHTREQYIPNTSWILRVLFTVNEQRQSVYIMQKPINCWYVLLLNGTIFNEWYWEQCCVFAMPLLKEEF